MRKVILFILVTIMITQASCSKKGDVIENNKNEKLYDVKLSVSTFSTEIVGMNSSASSSARSNTSVAADAIGEQISVLEYLIYNSGGVLVKNTVQEKTLSTFGSISEQLPAGDYKVYIFGSTEQFSVLNKESNTTAFVSPSIYNIGDWFMKSVDLKVSDKTQAQSIVLERAVGKIEVNITDAIPVNTAKITISSITASWINLNNSLQPATEMKTIETNVAASDIGKTNFVVGKYVVPENGGSIVSDISIRAYNASGALIADKIVKDVKVEKNKKTIMTGKLFTAPAINTGFSVRVNADWNTQNNEVKF